MQATDEQINIAIAEACPSAFHVNRYSDGKTQITWACNKNAHGPVETVDPLNDLNAMHEAEKVLNEPVNMQKHAWNNYKARLENSTNGSSFHATARQRAEEFIKTIVIDDCTH